MQFPTEKYINDKQSVNLGTKKLRRKFDLILKEIKKHPATDYQNYKVEQEIISHYNGGSKYYLEIIELSESIRNEFYKESQEYLILQTE